VRVTDQQLARLALAATENSYSPYSHSRVGAALEADGKIFTGTNVENRSIGLTICAERSAVVTAISAGARNFKRIAVAVPGDKAIPPCGACLQTLAEFCVDLKVLLVNGKGEIERTRLKKLYPRPFRPKK
jgi:cytidine deaminase